ncbi:hypothetical protein RHSIM_Rhsim01G0026300 [Rhododendron simsii]|uniref:Uncharacterized protein n=1 Tax=Rhododendron simsii TaxID=118357 RepID=A0A834HVK0_RHOSS|nr:hypothetical protein RHSIM_Rhsim01G0026300 [Rhododendron simsii]
MLSILERLTPTPTPDLVPQLPHSAKDAFESVSIIHASSERIHSQLSSGRGKKVSFKQDPLYYRDPTLRLVRKELESSQPAFSSSSSPSLESDSADYQSESIPISGLYIDLPFESVLCRALRGKVGKASSGWDIGLRKVRIMKDFSPCAFLDDLDDFPPPPPALSIIECHQDEVSLSSSLSLSKLTFIPIY